MVDDISEADLVMKEAKYLRDLEGKYIVKYIEDFIHIDFYSGKIEPKYFVIIIMEFCSGGDLKEEIDKYFYKNTNISKNQIIEYLYQICEGVALIHQKDILHRDIKSQNVFLTGDNEIRVGDFGLAKKIKKYGKTKSRNGTMTKVGTDCYMAPEIIEGLPYGKPVIFS
jgi:NIMA (never in mitosis gene a)-related kinase